MRLAVKSNPILLAVTLLCARLMAACQSVPPPLAFEHSTRVSVRHICLTPLGVPQRAEVSIMNPIGSGFGVVGNLIETHRAAVADAEMADVLSKARYDFGSALTNSVTLAMRKAGFTISRVEGARPQNERAKFLSKYPQRVQVDAFLDIYMRYVGFQAPQSSADYRPRVELIARLVSARGVTLFQSRIVYGSATAEDEDAILVRADESVSFRDRAALQANPSTTVRALQSAIDSVAWELAMQFM